MFTATRDDGELTTAALKAVKIVNRGETDGELFVKNDTLYLSFYYYVSIYGINP
jgi:hypothetical protein